MPASVVRPRLPPIDRTNLLACVSRHLAIGRAALIALRYSARWQRRPVSGCDRDGPSTVLTHRPSRGPQRHRVRPRCDELARRAQRGRGVDRPRGAGGDRRPATARSSSGGDLKELAPIRTHDDAVGMAGRMRQRARPRGRLPVPVVAALNGHALGGGAEVAIAADIRIAADDVRIGFNQVALGIMPAWGGAERLTALLGPGRALGLMTTGRVLDAEAGAHAGPGRHGGAPRGVRAALARGRGADRVRAPATRSSASRPPNGPRSRTRTPSSPRPPSRSFATTWVAEDHWRMVDEADQRRRAAREDAVAIRHAALGSLTLGVLRRGCRRRGAAHPVGRVAEALEDVGGVLAEERRGTMGVGAEGRQRSAARARSGRTQGVRSAPQPARARLRLDERAGDVVDGAARDADLAEARLPVATRCGEQDASARPRSPRRGVRAALARGEPVRRQRRVPHCVDEPSPHAVVPDEQREVAVGGAEVLRRHERRVRRVRGAREGGVAVALPRGEVGEHRDLHVEEADVDVRADTRSRSFHERGAHSQRRARCRRCGRRRRSRPWSAVRRAHRPGSSPRPAPGWCSRIPRVARRARSRRNRSAST